MSRRRYLSSDISLDSDINRLACEYGDFAVMLYTWLIPHAEDDATLEGNPEGLLYRIIPGRRDKTPADVAAALAAIAACNLIIWDREANKIYFRASTFYKYQSNIHKNRRRLTDPSVPQRQAPPPTAEPPESTQFSDPGNNQCQPPPTAGEECKPAQNTASLSSSSSLSSSLSSSFSSSPSASPSHSKRKTTSAALAADKAIEPKISLSSALAAEGTETRLTRGFTSLTLADNPEVEVPDPLVNQWVLSRKPDCQAGSFLSSPSTAKLYSGGRPPSGGQGVNTASQNNPNLPGEPQHNTPQFTEVSRESAQNTASHSPSHSPSHSLSLSPSPSSSPSGSQKKKTSAALAADKAIEPKISLSSALAAEGTEIRLTRGFPSLTLADNPSAKVTDTLAEKRSWTRHLDYLRRFDRRRPGIAAPASPLASQTHSGASTTSQPIPP